MKKYSIFMAAAALVFAASCNKIEEVNTPEPVVETELITVDLNPMTKTALGTEGSTTWDANDVVSVTVDGKKIGDLKLVEGSTFSGEVEAGHNGTALLHYPSGITVVPLTQTAIVGTFADEAALLDGETTMDALRAGEGVTLQNKTALLKFTVAQAGDVTFEVGTKKYTITGCKTGSTYYACVEPMNGVNLIARINGYHSKTTKTTVNIEESKILDLGELPKIMTSYWRVLGGYNEWNWDKGTQMYKEGMIVVKNVKFSQKNNRGFKFCYDNWKNQIGAYGSDNTLANHVANLNDWYGSENNSGTYKADFKLSDYNKSYDVYLDEEGGDIYFTEHGSPAPTLCWVNGIKGDWSKGIAMEGENDRFALRNITVDNKAEFKFTTKNGTWIGGGSYTLGSYADASASSGNISIDKGTYNIYLNSDRTKFMVEKIN